MGQIANQMLIEWFCKTAQKIGEKRKRKKDAGQDKSLSSEKTDYGSGKMETK